MKCRREIDETISIRGQTERTLFTCNTLLVCLRMQNYDTNKLVIVPFAFLTRRLVVPQLSYIQKCRTLTLHVNFRFICVWCDTYIFSVLLKIIYINLHI